MCAISATTHMIVQNLTELTQGNITKLHLPIHIFANSRCSYVLLTLIIRQSDNSYHFAPLHKLQETNIGGYFAVLK